MNAGISEDGIFLDELMNAKFYSAKQVETEIFMNVQKRGYAITITPKLIRLQVLKLLEEAFELASAANVLKTDSDELASIYRKLFVDENTPDCRFDEDDFVEIEKELADCIIPIVVLGKCISTDFSVLEQALIKSGKDSKRGVRN